MPDEPQAGLPPSEAAVIEDEVSIVEDEVDELQEALAVHSIMSEERHKEIIEGVQSCRESLEQIQNRLPETPGESPVLNRILEELTLIQTRLTTIETEARESRNRLAPNTPESIPQPSPSPNSPNPQNESVVDPARETPAIPKRKRFIKV
jgi:hypothetical protein